MSFPLPFSDARWENIRRFGLGGKRSGREYEACVICGRPVYTDRSPLRVRMDVDGNAITDAEAAVDPRYDQGCFVIGSDCLRRRPELKPYSCL